MNKAPVKYSSLAPFTRFTGSRCANNRRPCAWCVHADEPHMRIAPHTWLLCRCGQSEHTRHLPLNQPAKWLKPHTAPHKQTENIRTSSRIKILGYRVTKKGYRWVLHNIFSSYTRFFPQYVASWANKLTRPGLTEPGKPNQTTQNYISRLWFCIISLK